WYLAARACAGNDAERGSTIRSVYFALTFAVPFIFLVTSLRDLIERAGIAAGDAGAGSFNQRPVSEALAYLVVGGAIVGFPLWERRRDERIGVMAARALWPTRLYLYAASFTGLALLLAGVVEL